METVKPEAISPSPPANSPAARQHAIWPSLLFLVLAVSMFYLPVIANDFVNFDDRQTIYENPNIRSLSPQSLLWMLTTQSQGFWVPLTWLSLALNDWVGGLNPIVFHLTNVFFHVLNSLLVFLVCLKVLEISRQKTGTAGEGESRGFEIPTALVTALLFGLHPIHVESVAWATERKDVLYAFFYLAALWLYLDYAVSPLRKNLKLYACLGLYLLSLMSKPMAVTLPLVFLILDYRPLRRLPGNASKALVEKIPFFVLGALITLITRLEMAQISSINQNLPLFVRVLNAFHSLVFYLWKMVVPFNLSPFYPFPPALDNFYYFKNVLAAVLVILVCLACFYYHKKAPDLVAAWLYYLVSLAPVIGIIQVGSFAAADRYTYLASLGIFLPFSAVVVPFVFKRRLVPRLLFAVLTVLLGIGTVKQIGVWKNSQTFWERVVQAYPCANPNALTNLGALYLKEHRLDLALTLFQRAAAMPPPLAFTHDEMGIAFLYEGKVEDAIREFNTTLLIDPKDMVARQNLWNVYEHLGKHKAAIEEMKTATVINPDNPQNYTNLGVSYCFLKRYKEAEAPFEKALALEPLNAQNLVNLATVRLLQGRSDEALDLYQKGIAQNPREPVYYLKMADIYLDKKTPSPALKTLREALDLNPQDPKLIREIGEDFEKAGQKTLAQQCFEKAKGQTGLSGPMLNNGR